MAAVSTSVRALPIEEWPLLRATRIAALREAPYAFGATAAETASQPDEWWPALFEDRCWFVAESEGGVVGIIACDRHDEFPEIFSVWVHPDWRGRGVIDELVTTVSSWARSQGRFRLRLRVIEDNERAIRCYERLGFEFTGDSRPLRSNPNKYGIQLAMELG